MGNRQVQQAYLEAITLPVEDPQNVAEWYITQLDIDKVTETNKSITVAGQNGFAVRLMEDTPLEEPGRVRLTFYVENIEPIFARMNEMNLTPRPAKMEAFDENDRVITMEDRAGHTIVIRQVTPKEISQNLSLDQKVAPHRTSAR